ncbi:hypothetical protein GWI33_006170 [Rhynchophorus ferrugineus]|uniref:Uncharacterized protein n=1 Tax=Rhynchophorus ferrugineus TaxID=354439 RepID=A0A834IYQ4_RHYFE|nr:hypothetical protein GWI33_006170 [Rhynchophorus ferrugineus]
MDRGQWRNRHGLLTFEVRAGAGLETRNEIPRPFPLSLGGFGEVPQEPRGAATGGGFFLSILVRLAADRGGGRGVMKCQGHQVGSRADVFSTSGGREKLLRINEDSVGEKTDSF